MIEFVNHNPDQYGVAAALLLAACAVFFDLRERRIPNRLVVPAMGLGLLLNLIVFGPGGLAFAASGLLTGAILFLLPVALLNRGAGDLKLLAAIGSLCGPSFAFWSGLWAGVFGLVVALLVLFWSRRVGTVLAGLSLDFASGSFPVARSGMSIPYAIPVALGTVVAALRI
jgi:prepilin peptidase CpaA